MSIGILIFSAYKSQRRLADEFAYWKLKESSWDPRDTNWNIPWKFQGPQRVKVFIWLALKQRLLTNMERVRRGIGSDGSCTVCSFELEDILHAIRDCTAGKEILAQATLFGILASHIWKNRNIFIFQGTTWCPSSEILKGCQERFRNRCFWRNLVRSYKEVDFRIQQSQSYEKVLIQIDSVEVAKAIQESSLSSSNSALILRIHLILK
ncbi:hypothetical protein Goarm_007196, partial [Gossypium armourianum]|nr:hypothetical protein [Gossypium armourianum]